MYKLLLFSLAAFSLSACSSLHPANSIPHPQMQCQSLQHQQSMQNSNPNNQEHWQLQTKRQQLDQAYHKIGCDKIVKKDAQ